MERFDPALNAEIHQTVWGVRMPVSGRRGL